MKTGYASYLMTRSGVRRFQKHRSPRSERPTFAVLGAGNGGQAMAAHLAVMGLETTLFNRSRATLEQIHHNGGIVLEGVLAGFAHEVRLTDNIADAIAGGDVIMVTTPAFAHRDLARRMAPHLADGQLVVLNPGRTLGAVEFEYELRKNGCRADVVVAEAQSLLYACRAVEPGRVKVFSVKKSVPLAAFPGERTEEAISLLHRVFPQFTSAPSVLHTGLGNIGAVFHPGPVVLNVARIESGERFEHYRDGITPSVAVLLEGLDSERLQVAEAFGIELPSAREWLGEAYGSTGETLYQALQSTPAYKGLLAPENLQTRYLWEDVPTSLVPIASLGREAGVKTPVIDSIITLASHLLGEDFAGSGRTLRSLDLEGVGVEGIIEALETGRRVA